MSSFFFTLFHFNSLLCPERHGHAWILPEAGQITTEKGAILGELASVLVSPGTQRLGAGAAVCCCFCLE
jgi:hypothetical protein